MELTFRAFVADGNDSRISVEIGYRHGQRSRRYPNGGGNDSMGRIRASGLNFAFDTKLARRPYAAEASFLDVGATGSGGPRTAFSRLQE